MNQLKMAALKLAELAIVACLLLCLPMAALGGDYFKVQRDHSFGKWQFESQCGWRRGAPEWTLEEARTSAKAYAEQLRRRYVHGFKDRIAGGYFPQTKEENPSFAQLVVKGANNTHRPVCGAVLMGKHVALTAVNCIANGKVPYKADRLMVTPGVDKTDAETRQEHSRDVKKACMVLGRYDVAILLLDGPPLDFINTHLRPACLPDEQYAGEGQDMILTGMGETEQGPPTRHLRYFPVKFERCKFPIPEGRMTTCVRFSEPWQMGATCKGDGGSPVYAYSHRTILENLHMLAGIVAEPKHPRLCEPREASKTQIQIVDMLEMVKSGRLREMMRICTKELV